MQRETLREMGLSDENIDKVMADFGKQQAQVNRLGELEAANADLNKQITERDKQLKELGKNAAAGDELKETIKQLEADNKQAKEQYDANLKQVRTDAAIDRALLASGARNNKAVRALLDNDKLSLDGENVIGLDEQLKAIQEDNDYLFTPAEPAQPKGPQTKLPNGNPSGSQPPKAWDDMTLAEQTAAYRANPSLLN